MLRSYWKGPESDDRPQGSFYQRNSLPFDPLKWRHPHQFHGSGLSFRKTLTVAPHPLQPLCRPTLWQHPDQITAAERLLESVDSLPKTYAPAFPQFPKFGEYRTLVTRNVKISSEMKPLKPILKTEVSQLHHLNSVISGETANNKIQFPPPDQLVNTSVSNDAVKLTEDTGSFKVPSVLSALVNRLFEDPSKDKKTMGDDSSDFCFLENHTIGELAMKLADVVVMDEPSCQDILRSEQHGIQQPNHHLQGDVESQKSGQSHHKESKTPENCFKEETDRFHSFKRNKNKPKADTLNVTGNSKKSLNHGINIIKKNIVSKYGSWNGPKANLGSCHFKNVETVLAMPVNMKQGQRKRSLMTSRNYPVNQSKGMSTWVYAASLDSKSDSSSSSVDNVCKPLNHRPSRNLPKYKEYSKPTHYVENSRRPCKTSCSSSSSSGGVGRAIYTECVFCKTNGETASVYRNHILKDENGRTVCEVLQRYVCPLCGATGFQAHTVKYCPLNKSPPTVATMTTLKSMRSSTGRKRHGPCGGQIRQSSFHGNRNLLQA